MIFNMNGGSGGGIEPKGKIVKGVVSPSCQVEAGDMIQIDNTSNLPSIKISSSEHSYCTVCDICNEHIMILYNSSGLKGDVYKISDSTCTFVYTTKLANSVEYNGLMVAIGGDKYFIAYTSDSVLYGIVATVTENETVIHKTLQITSGLTSYYPGTMTRDDFSLHVCAENKIALAYNKNGFVVTICSIDNDNNISIVATKTISTANMSHVAMNVLNESTLVCGYGDDDDYAYLAIVKVNGSTITSTSFVQTTQAVMPTSADALDPIIYGSSTVFLPLCGGGSNSGYRSVLCRYKILNDTPSYVEYVTMGTKDCSATASRAVKCADGTYFFAVGEWDKFYIFNTSVAGNNTTPTVISANGSSGQHAIFTKDGRLIFIYHDTSDQLYGIIQNKPTVSRATSVNVFGIALTSGSDGEEIEYITCV